MNNFDEDRKFFLLIYYFFVFAAYYIVCIFVAVPFELFDIASRIYNLARMMYNREDNDVDEFVPNYNDERILNLARNIVPIPVFETIDLPRCSVQKNIIRDYFILNKYNGLPVTCVYQLFRINETFNLCGLCTPLPPDNLEVHYCFDVTFSVVMINDFLLDCQYCNNCGKNLFAVRVLQ
jgi:hypothetical protein